MNLEYIDINKLNLLNNNPRTISKENFEKLKKSIKNNPDYFEARPIICSDRTKKLVILAGNQRYKASQELGLKEVPCVVLKNLTEEREKEIIIRDNVELGDWDYDLLVNDWELEDLKEWGVDVPVYDDIEENENIDNEQKKLTKEQEINLNNAFIDFINETILNVKILLKNNYFDSNLTKTKAKINFLKSLYLNENYERYNNYAFQPHIIDIQGDQYSLMQGLEKIVNKEINVDRIKFVLQNKADTTKLFKNTLAFGGARMPADFPADLAKSIYNEFGNKGKVLDMCHGWGGRVVGFMLSDCEEYVGFDPSIKTFEGVKELYNTFNKYTKKDIKTYNLPFEKSNEKENYFDLAFTSPPYFDVEKYEGKQQSRILYNNFDLWVNGFYKQLIFLSKKYLKNNGYLILQVGNQRYPLGDIAKKYSNEINLTFIGERFSGMSNSQSNNEEEHGEMIYIFKKQQKD